MFVPINPLSLSLALFTLMKGLL